MEADEYFSTYEALHNDDGSRLQLRVRDTCPINKIIWSTFDFMSGPELKFSWEVTNSTSTSPISGDEGSINDAESLDSSISVRSGQFEDIDDPLQADLTLPGELYESMMVDSAAGYFFSSSPNSSGFLPFAEEYMQESRSTTTLTNSSAGMASSQISNQLTVSNYEAASWQSSNTCLASPNNQPECSTPRAKQDISPHDAPMAGIDLSSALTEQFSLTNFDEAPRRVDSNAGTTGESSFARLSESDGVETIYACPASKTEDNERSALVTSCVDSGIGGTISTHSDLSALCASPIIPIEERHRRKESSPDSLEEHGIENVFDISLDSMDELTCDETFVTKFVLAEQICSTQLSSNPLIYKMSVVPKRRLLVGSFIFSSESKYGEKQLHAVSFLLNHNRVDWLVERQSFLETLISDAVPRLKVSLLTEDWDDVIFRVTKDLRHLLNLLGCLERFSLVAPCRPIMIKNTLFNEKVLSNPPFLSKVISGVFQSQGHCVVVGSDQLYVSKLLNTLVCFVPEELHWCCMRSFRHKYDPYLRIQAIRRKELPSVTRAGIMSVWPICIIDVDHETVCMSANYSKHRHMRRRAELVRVRTILGQVPEDTADYMKLELSPCRVIEHVKDLVRQMTYLPLEESARIGFIQQFLLHLENTARAFIQFVRDESQPSPSEKINPLKSPSFSLSQCRKSLDLSSDAWFNAVLARAELLLPTIADFITES